MLLPNQLCIHGFKVTAGPKNKNKEDEPMINQKRTLKRRTTLLKHARFLQNLEVFPIYPNEPEPKADDEE